MKTQLLRRIKSISKEQIMTAVFKAFILTMVVMMIVGLYQTFINH